MRTGTKNKNSSVGRSMNSRPDVLAADNITREPVFVKRKKDRFVVYTNNG